MSAPVVLPGHRLLPPQTSALERAVADIAPLWDDFAGLTRNIETQRPTAYAPWLAAEWHVAQFAPYFPDLDALFAAGLPWLGPVGRLDKASEGLLLLSNDTTWAAGITDPATHLDKTYHVQVAGQPDAAVLAAMRAGIDDGGDLLKARRVTLLRAGEKNAWLEVVLDEGRNRHIRRLLAALGFDVLRLIRVSIGPLALGELAKGQWRQLSAGEVAALDTREG